MIFRANQGVKAYQDTHDITEATKVHFSLNKEKTFQKQKMKNSN